MLTGVFDREPSQMYLDWHHLTPEGNRLLAQAMAKVLVDDIVARSTPHEATSAPVPASVSR